MAEAKVKVHQSVEWDEPDRWQLCFQKVTYHYMDKSRNPQNGFRFIWKDPDGRLRPNRGQARIPTAKVLKKLLSRASKAGWFK
jgi:hypothetical protein